MFTLKPVPWSRVKTINNLFECLEKNPMQVPSSKGPVAYAFEVQVVGFGSACGTLDEMHTYLEDSIFIIRVGNDSRIIQRKADGKWIVCK